MNSPSLTIWPLLNSSCSAQFHLLLPSLNIQSSLLPQPHTLSQILFLGLSLQGILPVKFPVALFFVDHHYISLVTFLLLLFLQRIYLSNLALIPLSVTSSPLSSIHALFFSFSSSLIIPHLLFPFSILFPYISVLCQFQDCQFTVSLPSNRQTLTAECYFIQRSFLCLSTLQVPIGPAGCAQLDSGKVYTHD